MKPLNLKETALKEEMKERCLAKGQYIDEKAKAKFEMLCHLENFGIENWELKQRIDKAIDKLYCWGEALDPEFQKEMLEILSRCQNETIIRYTFYII